jgi:hypothetical protein
VAAGSIKNGSVRAFAVVVAGLAAGLGACSSNATVSKRSPCFTVCEKLNGCPDSNPFPCSLCTYGGTLLPGLGPAPDCPDLAAQQSCVEAAAEKSCAEFLPAVAACPLCPVLDGSRCSSDGDCQQYRSDYRCDLGRNGGYCTAACGSADDCSPAGPEVCTTARAPSFDPEERVSRRWCLLGCQSDASCRTAEGYRCIREQPTSDHGACDLP